MIRHREFYFMMCFKFKLHSSACYFPSCNNRPIISLVYVANNSLISILSSHKVLAVQAHIFFVFSNNPADRAMIPQAILEIMTLHIRVTKRQKNCSQRPTSSKLKQQRDEIAVFWVYTEVNWESAIIVYPFPAFPCGAFERSSSFS